MARKFAAVVFSLGCFQASPLMALGLGEMTLDSYLNEPLRAQVDLLNTGGLHEDQIRIRLATSEDFERMGVDRAYFLTSITFDVQVDDTGRSRIVITSEDPVLEPYLDFIVEARWPSGRLLREYTVLVDPPVFDNTTPVMSASAQVAEMDGEPAPAKKKTVATSGSGTRVDIRNSDLAPGEMPRRAFNATTAGAPQPGARYMISRDDTLWEIASNARPSGVSVQQTMLDIQRLNPDAFIDGNINRIKAGYIIYLPTEGEISTVDAALAKQEVREQNKAWREYKTTEPDYTSGPSLRISADPVEEAAAAAGAVTGSQATAGTAGGASGTAAMEDLEKSERERAELESRLAAMESQVETLQRIVSLKDDQIAALQGVLAGEQGEEDVAALTAEEALIEQVLEQTALRDDEAAAAAAQGTDAGLDAEIVGETPAAEAEIEVDDVAVVETVTEPEPAEPAVVAPEPVDQSGGFLSNLWYILAAVVAAVLAFVFMRRRKGEDESGDDEDIAPVATPARSDSFADVELSEQPLEVEQPEEPALPLVEDEAEPGDTTTADSRGYGQRKHDEYASDVEASDALAEADIYIAYGRYPQAFELLKNALQNDPRNPEYRLKLVQMYAETGDRDAAQEQLGELEAIGDAASLASAREALDAMDASPSSRAAVPADFDEAAGEDLMAEIDDSLEADFSGLEIEEPGEDELEDELDLSTDFDEEELAPERLDEDLVVAAESNGMSTKLDLARAYMDMGDDDGARQILEEVAAEGSEELKAEARELLERIG